MSEKFSIALVEHVRSPVVEVIQVTFQELAKMYAQPEIGKKDGYGVVFADIDEGPRTAARVRSISFLGLDVEGKAEAVKDENGEVLLDEHSDIIKRVTGVEPPSVDEIVAVLAELNWPGIVHTTYSHTDEHPRYRLIIEPSHSLQKTELKLFGLHVADLLGISDCFDTTCLDASRLYFLPRVPSEKRKAWYRCEVVEGAPLDVDALLADARLIEALNPSPERVKSTPENGSVINAFNAKFEASEILEEHGYLPKGCNRWLYSDSTTGDPGVRLLPDQGSGKHIYSSHGGDPLNDGYAHDVFDCYRILKHDGDMGAAVKAAAELFGLVVGVVSGGMPEPFTNEIPPTLWPVDCLQIGMAEAAQAIAEHVNAPDALAGLSVLAAVSHVVMRLIDAQHPKKGVMPASLYILVALESGGRKTECLGLATQPIKELERQAREAFKKSQVSSAALAGSDPRTIFGDSTIQKIESEFVNGSAPALSLITDEGGILLGGHSMKADTRVASLGGLTRLFDGSGVQRDRVGEGQSGFRYGVRFGLFLSAQPVVLIEALSDALLRGQGFLPRFMYAYPESLAGSRLLSPETLTVKAEDDPRLKHYWAVLEQLCRLPVNVDEHGGLVLPMVEVDSEAVFIWLDYYNETERQQGKGGTFEYMAAFASRAGELSARVAAVYAAWNACENGTEMSKAVVTGDDMRRAVALVGYSLAEWLRHESMVSLTYAEVDAMDLLEMLHRKGWSSTDRGQIGQYCKNGLRSNRKRRNAAIDELMRRGWLIDSGTGSFSIVQ